MVPLIVKSETAPSHVYPLDLLNFFVFKKSLKFIFTNFFSFSVSITFADHFDALKTFSNGPLFCLRFFIFQWKGPSEF